MHIAITISCKQRIKCLVDNEIIQTKSEQEVNIELWINKWLSEEMKTLL